MSIRFLTNSGTWALGSSWITSFTTTPPTGIPKSVNRLMNRRITAIGSASGRVTKKNAVCPGSVSSSLACSIRPPEAEKVLHQRVLFLGGPTLQRQQLCTPGS